MLKKIIVSLLTIEAKLVLRKYKPHIVAITGSVGKTSTKDAIYTILASKYHTRKSEKSFNSEIGIPLTILGIPNGWKNPLRWIQNLFDGLMLILFPLPFPKWLVLEVGADRPGDIRSLSSWLTTDVAVITRLPDIPVHVEFFNSPEDVVQEKASIIDSLKFDGTLVVYGDTERSPMLTQRAHTRGANVISFGLSKSDDVQAKEIALIFEEGKNQWPIGIRAQISILGKDSEFSLLNTIGAQALLAALAALAVGVSLDIDLPSMIDVIQFYKPPLGRMGIIEGIKDTFIIDDTYNSSPAAITAALDATAFLKRIITSRKVRVIAVLGDMLELGRHSVVEHRKIGVHTAQIADILITVGFRARDIAQGALDEGMPDSAIFQFEDAKQAGIELQNILKKGDCVLVKGSQSIRTEKIIEEIMAHPENASKLLVRQDEEWKKR